MIDQPPQYYFVFASLNSTKKNATKNSTSSLSQLPPIDIAQGNMYSKNFDGFNY